MLCNLILERGSRDGPAIALNYLDYFVSDAYPPEREEIPRAVVLRGAPATWTQAEWSGGAGGREKKTAEGCCYGFGRGCFECEVLLGGVALRKTRLIKLRS